MKAGKARKKRWGRKSIEDVLAKYLNDSDTEEYLDRAAPLQVIRSPFPLLTVSSSKIESVIAKKEKNKKKSHCLFPPSATTRRRVEVVARMA